MKFAVVGAGAIGGYLGARLAIAGEEVTFIARNRNLAAINANGFKLIEEDGSEQHTRAVRAVQSMADAGPQDVVLLTVKAHQVIDLLPGLRDLFGPQTLVVTMINGIPWWYIQGLAGPHQGRGLDSVDPGGQLAAAIELTHQDALSLPEAPPPTPWRCSRASSSSPPAACCTSWRRGRWPRTCWATRSCSSPPSSAPTCSPWA